MNCRRWQIPALCGVVAASAFVAAMLFWPQKPVPPRRAPATASMQALSRLHDLQLNDYQGKSQPFSQWKGKILVINFWAAWCAPCREEMPYFSRISRDYAEKGVQFVGISSDSAATVRGFADREKISYPLLVGGQHTLELSAALGNSQSGLPFTAIVGRNGEPLLAHTGRLSESELESLLSRHNPQ